MSQLGPLLRLGHHVVVDDAGEAGEGQVGCEFGRDEQVGFTWRRAFHGFHRAGRPQRIYDLRSARRLTMHGDGRRALIDRQELDRLVLEDAA